MQTISTSAKASNKKANKVQRRYQHQVERAQKMGTATPPSEKLALYHSRYLQSILDPWNCTGSKIPDEITIPSFPMAASTKVVAQVAAGVNPGPVGRGICYNVGSTAQVNASKYMILNASTTVADTYVTAGPAGNWAPGAQLVSVAQSCRPVSAGLFVSVQASSNNDQGRIIVGFMPPFDPLANVSVTPGSSITATSLDNLTFSTSIPVSKVSGRSIWLPLDDIARSYLVSGANAYTNGLRGANVPVYGVLFALVDGAAAGTNIEFTICENFECVPISSQVNIAQPEVSKSDPLEMALAGNFVAAHPTLSVFQPTSSILTGTPMSGTSVTRPASDSGSIMDKILSGLLTGAKVASKIAPVAAEVLAML